MDRSALILYGSETGNAHDIAEELGRTTQRLHFSSEVLSLDSVEPSTLNAYSIVLISISTAGQGDLPASSRLFWKKLLRKKLPPTYLAETRLAVFGLGDTSYPQYNWAALKLHKRLQQLGAAALVPRGEGDEQHPEGVDASFVPWLQGLKETLIEGFPLPDSQEPISDTVLLQPAWLLGVTAESDGVINDGETAATATNDGLKASNPNENAPFEVDLRWNERVTAKDHFQDVRHLGLTCSDTQDYLPGDILTIHPKNVSEDVDSLLHLMHWEDVADQNIEFAVNPLYQNPKRPSRPSFFQSQKASKSMTLRQALTSELDFNAIPRRSFFALIAHFTEDEFQKERLLEFASPELIDELFDYTTRPRRSIFEVLQEFDTLSIPWQWAASILPRLRGRQFSIASGGVLKQPTVSQHDVSWPAAGTKFELLVAIVKYRTVIKKIRRGVCTRYLEDLQPGARMSVTLQRGALGITSAELEKPVVMVGPGTGLAPIRALIWQRWLWAQSQASSTNPVQVGPMALFFGCRNKKSDYFFRDEWEQLRGQGVPLTVFTAFSRDQDKKVYVQDLLRKELALLFELLHQQKGIVFVCGSSGRMPQAVRGALLEVLEKGAKISPVEAEAELKSMEKQSRYKQETW